MQSIVPENVRPSALFMPTFSWSVTNAVFGLLLGKLSKRGWIRAINGSS
jgi:hypothetical protein